MSDTWTTLGAAVTNVISMVDAKRSRATRAGSAGGGGVAYDAGSAAPHFSGGARIETRVYPYTLTLSIGDRPVIPDIDATLHLERERGYQQWHLTAVDVLDLDNKPTRITFNGAHFSSAGEYICESILGRAIWIEATLIVDTIQHMIDLDAQADSMME